MCFLLEKGDVKLLDLSCMTNQADEKPGLKFGMNIGKSLPV